MNNRKFKKAKVDEPLPKTPKSPKTDNQGLATIKMEIHSPIQDLLCRDEYQDLFEDLLKNKRST